MEHPELQTLVDQQAAEKSSEQEKKTRGILSRQLLRRENQAYAGTLGVSQNNNGMGFLPG